MFGLVLLPLMALFSLFTDSGGGGGSDDGKGAGDGSQGSQDANAGGQQGGNGSQGNQQQGEQANGFKPIASQDDFDAAIKTRLAQQERSLTKSITDTVTAAIAAKQAADTAKEQGDFKTLSETQATKIAELEGQIAKQDRATLVTKVAAVHKLPDELAELLQGDDEAALTEHAKRLAKLVKPAGAPDTEAGSGNRSGATRPNPAVTKKLDPETPLVAADGTQKVAWPSS